MASTFDNNLRLAEMATGDQDGTWGTQTNTNLSLITDAFKYGSEAIADASTATITMANATADVSEPPLPSVVTLFWYTP